MKIFYEDKHLVVCEKPSGVPSQGDSTGKDSMISLLSCECNCEIFCVHRLDTPTGGIMVYAKSSSLAGKLSSALSDDSAKKKYICAVCATELFPNELEDLLFHDKRKNKSFVTNKMRKGVKKASLSYFPVSQSGELSLLCVTLHTGRTHQIRVQLSSRGMPLLGDGKYGSNIKGALALYCFHLSFVHPITKKTVSVTNLPPSPWFGFELSDIFSKITF